MKLRTPLVTDEEVNRFYEWRQARKDIKASIINYTLQRLTIQACNVTEAPIKDLVILNSLNERCHTVFYVPHGQIIKAGDLDPVIPLTTFSLGPRHTAVMRPLVRHFIFWDSSETFDAQQVWGRQAMRLASEVERALKSPAVKSILRPDEISYMVHYLNLAIAAPHGGIQENQIEWQEEKQANQPRIGPSLLT